MGRITKWFIAAAFALVCLSALGTVADAQHAQFKVLLIVLEPPESPSGYAKVMRALEFARQLKVSSIETELVFDGGGVRWLTFLEDLPASMLPDELKSEEWKKHVGSGKRRQLGQRMSALKAAGLRPAATRSGAGLHDMEGALDAVGIRWVNGNGDLDITKYIADHRILIF